MQSRLFNRPVLLVLTVLAGPAAMAAECDDTPLSEAQSRFLAENNLTLNRPQGEVEIIQRCDTNGDKMVDILDIREITLFRNQPASHMTDPKDYDGNGMIDLLDVRGCQLLCGEARCAINPNPPEEQTDGVLEAAECFQTESIATTSGEVEQVVVAITENRPSVDQAKPVKLGLVIMREKPSGEVQFYKDSFAGESRDGKVGLHVVKQPAGEVNLLPGRVIIDEPGTVTFHNGEPKILYYWQNGRLRRAPFRVDD